MSSSSPMDEVANLVERVGFLPPFKEPIELRDLASGDRRVIFEISQTSGGEAESLFPEDEDEHDDEDDPVTDTDPQRYSARRKTRALIESFGMDPEISFQSFYEPEKMAEMKNISEDGSVRKTIIREGNGPQIPENCKVYVHYIICGDGLSDPYDSTVSRGYPDSLDMRTPNIIPGLFIAIKSMRIREVAKFWVHSDYAYGEFGCSPRIPPKMDLHCIVEVCDIIEEDKLKLIPYMTPDERAVLEFDKILEAAHDLRSKANSDYKHAAYWFAVKKYRKAINILEDYGTQNQDEQDKRQDMVYTLYANLSAAFLKLQKPKPVCTFCQMALRSANYKAKENDDKLYYRFAEAKLMLGNSKDAKALNAIALRKAPNDAKILEQKKKILADIANEQHAEKILSRKMGKGICSGSPTKNQTQNETEQKNTPKESLPSEPKKVDVAIPEKEIKEIENSGKISPPIEWEDFDKLSVDPSASR